MTKNKQRIIFLGVIAAVATSAGIVSTFLLGPDNPVEQTGESVTEYAILEATGQVVDLDFSPQK